MGNVQWCDNRLLDQDECEENSRRVRRSIVPAEKPMLFEKKKTTNIFAPNPNRKNTVSRFSDIATNIIFKLN